MLSCSIWFSAPSFWMGGGLESSCVCRVYGADGTRHHPHRTHDLLLAYCTHVQHTCGLFRQKASVSLQCIN